MSQHVRASSTIFLLVALAAAAAAQPQRPGGQPQRSGAAASDTGLNGRVDPRSPRAAITDFLTLTRHGQFGAAARYLTTTPAQASRSADLARRLKAVLNQNLAIDLELLSPLAAGDTIDDGLPPNIEQLATVRNGSGVQQPVQLQRGTDPAWVFTPRTVERIDAWYNALPDHWLRDRMPVVFQQPGPFGVDRWQWVAIGVLLLLALLIGWLAGRATISIARRAVRRTETTLDDRLLEHASAPLLALWSLFAFRGLVELAGLSIFAEHLVSLIVRALSSAIATWLFVRATYVLERELPASQAGQRSEIRSFAPLIGRVTRIFIIAIGAIAIVSQFGYSVAALLAGVGIGGIALAFAAQKTLEHPFGSLAIGLDQPIRIGDWVRIGETEGEVESIGLRSTRLRTLARTVVVFPNGRLAEMPMENFGVRDRVLLRTRIGLTYETSVAQVRRVRDEIERVLVEHPLVWPDKIIVRFKGFGESSLDIDVISWIVTTDFNIFRAAREEIFLKFMAIVRDAGCTFAYRTQTLHVASHQSRFADASHQSRFAGTSDESRFAGTSDTASELAQRSPDDELKAGPGLVHGADLGVDQTEG
jgi:MscS family membrane protein